MVQLGSRGIGELVLMQISWHDAASQTTMHLFFAAAKPVLRPSKPGSQLPEHTKSHTEYALLVWQHNSCITAVSQLPLT